MIKTKFTILCFVFALCANINTANAQVNVQDSLALVDLYDSTNGPNWYDNTNWLTSNPVSTWDGITVTSGRVTAIVLAAHGLAGSIPSSIGNLVNLQKLLLPDNLLVGSIPSSIGNLVKLQILDLDDNQFKRQHSLIYW